MKDSPTYCYEKPDITQQRLIEKERDLAGRLASKIQEKEAVSEQAAYLRGALEMMREMNRFNGG